MKIRNLKVRNQKGFSMMELIVVMGVFLVIICAVFSLMRGTILTLNANYQLTDANQNLRNAQEYITRDVLIAGDGLRNFGNIWLPTAFVSKYLTIRSVKELDPDNTGFTSIGSIVSDNNLPASVAIPNSEKQTTVKERSDRITILAVDPNFTPKEIPPSSFDYATGSIIISSGVTDFNIGEIYCLTDGGSATFGIITAIEINKKTIKLAQGDSMGLNQTAPTGSFASISLNNTGAVLLERVWLIQYFVDNNNLLIRRVFGAKGKSIADSVVAEHIQTLQFDYISKPKNLSETAIYDVAVDNVDLSQKALIRLVGISVLCETAGSIQNTEKSVVEGKVLVGVRNLQFSEAIVPVDSTGNTSLTNQSPAPLIPSISYTPPPTPIPIETPNLPSLNDSSTPMVNYSTH